MGETLPVLALIVRAEGQQSALVDSTSHITADKEGRPGTNLRTSDTAAGATRHTASTTHLREPRPRLRLPGAISQVAIVLSPAAVPSVRAARSLVGRHIVAWATPQATAPAIASPTGKVEKLAH